MKKLEFLFEILCFGMFSIIAVLLMESMINFIFGGRFFVYSAFSSSFSYSKEAVFFSRESEHEIPLGNFAAGFPGLGSSC